MAFAVVAVPVAAAVDSTSAADFSVARGLVAGCQPHHGKGMVVGLDVSVDQAPERRAILPTSEGAAPVRIGPRPPDRLREVGPARLNPPGQACRDRHSPSTRIADCQIPETLE